MLAESFTRSAAWCRGRGEPRAASREQRLTCPVPKMRAAFPRAMPCGEGGLPPRSHRQPCTTAPPKREGGIPLNRPVRFALADLGGEEQGRTMVAAVEARLAEDMEQGIVRGIPTEVELLGIHTRRIEGEEAAALVPSANCWLT